MQDFTNTRESTRIKRPRELVVTVELPEIVRVVGNGMCVCVCVCVCGGVCGGVQCMEE